jgi:hypothetical protein
MTNYYDVFYWMSVSDGVKHFFDIASNIFTGASIISLGILIITTFFKANSVYASNTKTEEEDKLHPDVRAWEMARKYCARLFYISLPLCIIFWMGYVLTPTKKDCLMIVAGGAVGNFITTDSSSKALPADVTKFLHLSLKKEISSLGDDVKREFDIQTPKEKLMDKVKELTKEQLIDYIKADSTITINK